MITRQTLLLTLLTFLTLSDAQRKLCLSSVFISALKYHQAGQGILMSILCLVAWNLVGLYHVHTRARAHTHMTTFIFGWCIPKNGSD